jgi:RNA polymerase sigma-70 factor, ECF subfamily
VNEPYERVMQNPKAASHAAFDRVQRRYAPELTAFVQQLAGERVDVDDVVQTAFLALYRRLSDIEPASVRAYLYRIARNLCIDALRRAGRFEHVPFDDMAEPPEVQHTTFTSPDVDAEWRDILRRVSQAMDRLPEMQRQTMILYAEADLSYREIAEVMNVEVGTVKSRIHHARKNIRLHLEPGVLRDLGMEQEGTE